MDILNAFSINMLSGDCNLRFAQVSEAKAAELVSGGFNSHVGHDDMASVMSSILGVTIPMNRNTFTIGEGDILIGQYRGPRLPEGAKELPAGAIIEWWLVSSI